MFSDSCRLWLLPRFSLFSVPVSQMFFLCLETTTVEELARRSLLAEVDMGL